MDDSHFSLTANNYLRFNFVLFYIFLEKYVKNQPQRDGENLDPSLRLSNCSVDINHLGIYFLYLKCMGGDATNAHH